MTEKKVACSVLSFIALTITIVTETSMALRIENNNYKETNKKVNP